jgi:hypothetical protein
VGSILRATIIVSANLNPTCVLQPDAFHAADDLDEDEDEGETVVDCEEIATGTNVGGRLVTSTQFFTPHLMKTAVLSQLELQLKQGINAITKARSLSMANSRRGTL